jgi:hypothetical protein
MNKDLLSEYDISLLECYMMFKNLEKESHRYTLNNYTSVSSIHASIENNSIPLYWDGKHFSNVIHNDNFRKLKIYFDIQKTKFDKTIFIKKYKTLFNDANKISTENLVEMKNDLEFLLK